MADPGIDSIDRHAPRQPPRRILGWPVAAVCWASIALAATLAVGTTVLRDPRPLLLWNASASSPVGLYAIGSPAKVHVGELVVAWAPGRARRLAAVRAYLPFQVPLVKAVAAAGADRVCARGRRILVNGRLVAVRRRNDPSGRPMPWWSGCVRLAPGDLFLLSGADPLAFDGRYFGPTRAVDLVGTARLLLRKPSSDFADD